MSFMGKIMDVLFGKPEVASEEDRHRAPTKEEWERKKLEQAFRKQLVDREAQFWLRG